MTITHLLEGIRNCVDDCERNTFLHKKKQQYHHIPLQTFPVPSNPVLHLHEYDPTEFVQVAFE